MSARKPERRAFRPTLLDAQLEERVVLDASPIRVRHLFAQVARTPRRFGNGSARLARRFAMAHRASTPRAVAADVAVPTRPNLPSSFEQNLASGFLGPVNRADEPTTPGPAPAAPRPSSFEHNFASGFLGPVNR